MNQVTVRTISQQPPERESRVVRVRSDVFEEIRNRAHFSRKTKAQIVDEILRAHFGLPPATGMEESELAGAHLAPVDEAPAR